MALLDAMQNYFEFTVISLCGIPAVVLEGACDDWRAIAERVERLAALELDLAWWLDPLRWVVAKLSAAAGGEDDRAFWEVMYKHHDASGGDEVQGWLATFFPYLSDEGQDAPSRALDQGRQLYESQRKQSSPDSPLGPKVHDFPSGLSLAPFTWKYHDKEFAMEFAAGFVGIAQDRESLALRPEIGWAVRRV